MKWKAMAAVAVLLLIGGWRASDIRRQQQIGAANERARVATIARDSLARTLAEVAKRYRVDTIRLRETRTVRESVFVEVSRWLHDTVAVPVDVVREIVVADSQVIAACLIALSTCEQEKSLLRRDIALVTAQRDAYQRQIPSGFSVATKTARDVFIGVLIKVGFDAITRR